MGSLNMGTHSYGSIKVVGPGEVHVGKYCSIASNVTALMVGHDPSFVSTYPFNSKYMSKQWPEAIGLPGHPTTKGSIVIHNDVWIGYGATIMSGVEIASGAVVGALSVVTKDVGPYRVVAGSPARVYYSRIFEDYISAMLDIAWWNWPEERVRNNVHLLCSNNVAEFINKHWKRKKGLFG